MGDTVTDTVVIETDRMDDNKLFYGFWYTDSTGETYAIEIPKTKLRKRVNSENPVTITLVITEEV